MINRILIRIKVVQMLYSYLLVEKDFSLESQPSAPTKEKRFAYSLYLDLLTLMVQLSDTVERRGQGTPLAESRFIKGVKNDDRMRSLLARYRAEGFPFASVASSLAEKIKTSAIFKDYCTRGRDIPNADATVWKNIFDLIIVPDAALDTEIRRRENYTMHGVERARELMQTTFTDYFSSRGDSVSIQNALRQSLDAARELYFRLLWLTVELTELRERQLDDARHKYLPSAEDLNPSLRFVENQLVAAIRENPEVAEFTEKQKISWRQESPYMLQTLLKTIMETDIYRDYMAAPVSDFATDCEFWRNIYRQVIFTNETFLAELEDKSVFWNDDLDIIGTFVLKTLKRFDEAQLHGTQGTGSPILPKFKDEEDARFGRELMGYVLAEKESYRELIDEFIDKRVWDTERIALMDMVILYTAMAELLHFEKIPAQVTVNEYIEMARAYSAPKSAQFVHGILGVIINRLNEEGRIRK